MTISLYSGTPGSGKSLHQAMDIYYGLKYGKPVVTNFEINPDFVEKSKGGKWYRCVDNEELSPEWLIKYSQEFWEKSGEKFREGRIKLYIDECQILFNAREWDSKGDKGKKNSRKEWIKFFTQHRKYGYEIYLVAQFDRMIDRQLRSLIEYEYSHRKLTNMGWRGWFLKVCMGGAGFICVKRWYPLRERLGAEILRPRKRYFRIYDSYKLFDEEGRKANVKTAQLAAGEVVAEVAENAVEAVFEKALDI